jgi:lipoyl(octanoyl) transferase
MPIIDVYWLGTRNYQDTHERMQSFTDARTIHSCDQIWLLEHPPIYTAGPSYQITQIGNDIPVIKTNRGGKITYHGPGQLIAYVLIDLVRLKEKPHGLIDNLETATITYLNELGIKSNTHPCSRGVFINDQKIASIGIRVRKGCSFHGLALNINMSLAPFAAIDPCGIKNLAMTQIGNHAKVTTTKLMGQAWSIAFAKTLKHSVNQIELSADEWPKS